jgi:Fe-S-cluster containining protein
MKANTLTDKRKSELCLKCLECCKILLFKVTGDQLTVEFYKTRGFKTHTVDDFCMVEIPSPCIHLTTFGCSIYPVRPEACREYDGSTHPIMKEKCLWIKEK